MEILTLNIRQKEFNQIVSGEKKIEYRDVTPENAERYIETDEEGYIVENPDSYVNPYYPRKYDAIRFNVGCSRDRDTALVKIENAECKAIFNDEGKFYYEGDPHGEDFFVHSRMEYHLGEIIEKQCDRYVVS